jgi:hypothetical protein
MPTPKAEKATKSRKTSAKKKTAAAAPEPIVIRPTHDEIARRAHQMWIERGRTHGKHEEDWLRAEQELMKAS